MGSEQQARQLQRVGKQRQRRTANGGGGGGGGGGGTALLTQTYSCFGTTRSTLPLVGSKPACKLCLRSQGTADPEPQFVILQAAKLKAKCQGCCFCSSPVAARWHKPNKALHPLPPLAKMHSNCHLQEHPLSPGLVNYVVQTAALAGDQSCLTSGLCTARLASFVLLLAPLGLMPHAVSSRHMCKSPPVNRHAAGLSCHPPLLPAGSIPRLALMQLPSCCGQMQRRQRHRKRRRQ